MSRKRTTSKSSKSSGSFFAGLFADTPANRQRNRSLFAISLLLAGLFALIAFLSFFFTGNSDASVVESGGSDSGDPQNWMGYLGAKVADLLVRRGFGIMSFVLPVWAILWGATLIEETVRPILRRFWKYGIFGLLWGATFFGFLAILQQPEEPNFNLGGAIGDFFNLFLFNYIGKIGTGILLVFTFISFLIYIGRAEFLFQALYNIIDGVTNTVSSASKTIQEKTPATQDKAQSIGTQLKMFRKNLLNPNVEEDTEASKKPANSPKTNRPIANPEITQEHPQHIDTPPVVDAPPQAETPKEILFNTKDKTPVVKPKDSSGQLELEIAEGDIELEIQESSPVVSREQLGDDNLQRVVTEDGTETIEKIVNEEDEEVENPEDIDWDLYDPTLELSTYEKPTVDLLKDHGSGKSREVNRTELEENKNKIVKALKDFGIEIQSIKATIGPTVTLYEIVPASGVRISKIRNLEDDIALNLAALGIRIIAPMPGKGTIGIEIPNSNPEIVSLRNVLFTEKFMASNFELPLALGRTISNEVYAVDLNKLPHLLMAGSTGQGKSVGINTIIASLLYRKHPSEIKFVLIDPKKVELNLYQPLLHHFLAVMPEQTEPTITDSKDAIAVLKSLCIEMDNRYSLLKVARCRNLKEYNTKFLHRNLNPRKGHKFLPYIVLIIDELADLMMVAGKEVEMPIARLAQLARAVGIHLVVATQRPSVNVITGIIKANFPARLSYRVISKVDSRTILDANGADQLIGRGDLLLSTGNDIIRIQNAYIDTPEVEKIVDFISRQRGYPIPYFLPDAPADAPEAEDDDLSDLGDVDDMFAEAARVVVRYQLGSASLIQRKLKLGYARAGRIIDQLERAGIVGTHSGSKAREVLITDEASLEKILSNGGY